MKCHLLIYKPLVTTFPYENIIKKLNEKETIQKKELFYREILKFKSSRYPVDFIERLEN